VTPSEHRQEAIITAGLVLGCVALLGCGALAFVALFIPADGAAARAWRVGWLASPVAVIACIAAAALSQSRRNRRAAMIWLAFPSILAGWFIAVFAMAAAS